MLIDFDNFIPPAAGLDPSAARHLLLRCIELMRDLTPDLRHLDVRLYGGWRAGGMLSQRGSQVAALLRSLDPFPLALPDGHLLRGSLAMAFGLASLPAAEFDDTFRVRGSIPRIRLSSDPTPAACTSDSHSACPARILKQFTKSGRRACPMDGCTVTAESAFSVSEQKMVDTLITCDLLEFTRPAWRYSQLAIISGDTDFVPPLIYAQNSKGPVVRLIAPAKNWHPEATRLLTTLGISVSELEKAGGTRRSA